MKYVWTWTKESIATGMGIGFAQLWIYVATGHLLQWETIVLILALRWTQSATTPMPPTLSISELQKAYLGDK